MTLSLEIFCFLFLSTNSLNRPPLTRISTQFTSFCLFLAKGSLYYVLVLFICILFLRSSFFVLRSSFFFLLLFAHFLQNQNNPSAFFVSPTSYLIFFLILLAISLLYSFKLRKEHLKKPKTFEHSIQLTSQR